MKLVSIQASAFKSTFEVLKDILNDVNIYFRPQGMYIVTLDTARTSLIDMFLASDNFEEYQCDQEEIIAGINISNTFKLLKTITNNDVLCTPTCNTAWTGYCPHCSWLESAGRRFT